MNDQKKRNQEHGDKVSMFEHLMLEILVSDFVQLFTLEEVLGTLLPLSKRTVRLFQKSSVKLVPTSTLDLKSQQAFRLEKYAAFRASYPNLTSKALGVKSHISRPLPEVYFSLGHRVLDIDMTRNSIPEDPLSGLTIPAVDQKTSSTEWITIRSFHPYRLNVGLLSFPHLKRIDDLGSWENPLDLLSRASSLEFLRISLRPVAGDILGVLGDLPLRTTLRTIIIRTPIWAELDPRGIKKWTKTHFPNLRNFQSVVFKIPLPLLEGRMDSIEFSFSNKVALGENKSISANCVTIHVDLADMYSRELEQLDIHAREVRIFCGRHRACGSVRPGGTEASLFLDVLEDLRAQP